MTWFYKVLHYQSITYYRFSIKLMKVITIFRSIVQLKLLEFLKNINISDILCSIFVIKKVLWKVLKFRSKKINKKLDVTAKVLQNITSKYRNTKNYIEDNLREVCERET